MTLRLQNVNLDMGGFALRDVCFDVPAGACCVLLGRTGSGKSLLVETICGLRRPDGGTIHLGDRNVTGVDPAARNIGYVPQDYALMPFMTVSENIAFGLHARGIARRQRQAIVADMMSRLRITPLADRSPRRLSGGERQRVALGRALVIQPDLLLLDEPLSALDQGTADDLIEQLLDLRRQFAVTTVHICHVLEEALRLADMLVLIDDGGIVQVGPPAELFSRPRNLFVARLLRLPAVVPGEIRQVGHERRFCIGDTGVAPTTMAPGPAHAVIDPRRITISTTPPGNSQPGFRATVQPNPLAPLRPELRVAGQLNLTIPGHPPTFHPFDPVFVSFPPEAVHVLEPD